MMNVSLVPTPPAEDLCSLNSAPMVPETISISLESSYKQPVSRHYSSIQSYVENIKHFSTSWSYLFGTPELLV
jgi:hypothetical protein